MKHCIKKWMAAGLTIALSLGAFTGCSSSSFVQTGTDESKTTKADSESLAETTKEPETTPSENPVTITVYSQLAGYEGPQTGWLAKVLLNKFNVKLDIVNDADGQWLAEAVKNGGVSGIVIWGSDGEDYEAAIKDGLLYDWNQEHLLDEHGAYIKEHLQKAIEKNMEISGGSLYGIGQNQGAGEEDIDESLYTWDIRFDLYDQLGKPEAKGLDDYLELMKQMKEICPTDDNGEETYALSLWKDWDSDLCMYVKSFASAYYGYDGIGFGFYDTESGDFYDCLKEDGPYMNSLRFINELFQNDLIDPASESQTYAEMSEKMAAGGCFSSIFYFAGSALFNTEEHAEKNKMMLPLVPEDAAPLTYGISQAGGNLLWTIGADTEYPELCMDIINWFYTPEGCLTLTYGPKGATWDYDDEGYLYLTEFGLQAMNDCSIDMIGDYADCGCYSDGRFQGNNTTWDLKASNLDSRHGESYDYTSWIRMQPDSLCDTEESWREYAGTNTVMNYIKEKTNYRVLPAPDGSIFSKPEGELLNKWEKVSRIIIDGTWKAIYAKDDAEFEQLVQNMREEAVSNGYEECASYCQENAKEIYESR